MEPCQACMPSARGYVLQFDGQANQHALHTWLTGDKFTPYRKMDNQSVWVPEISIPHLLDYFSAHMQAEHIRALICDTPEQAPTGDWLTLDDVRQRNEAHWIDDVIAEQRLRTFFQPIVTVQNGVASVQGYEFLSRGIGEDGAIIPPFKLFEAARTRGRLFALDRACRITAVRNAAQVRDKMIFVNFIPTAIYSPEHCLQTTLTEARLTGVDPRQFVFEVVETDEVQEIEHLENILLYYRKHGFRYALDDVGAGYSTIEKVERLKPDFVKLDMHYVQGVADDFDKQQTARELLRTANAVGSRTLAEGVERPEDWRWLIEAGFELFQGYLFGKPEPQPEKNTVALHQ